MQIKLSELIDRRHVIPGLSAADKAQVLDELATRAGIALKRDAHAIADALKQREKLGSTGVGGGFAIPHARIDGLAQCFGLLARLDRAIDFAAIDGAPVDLVFLLLIPADANPMHLPALAAVSRCLRDPKVARALREAPTAKDMFEALVGRAA